jgi:hypothetical protein
MSKSLWRRESKSRSSKNSNRKSRYRTKQGKKIAPREVNTQKKSKRSTRRSRFFHGGGIDKLSITDLTFNPANSNFKPVASANGVVCHVQYNSGMAPVDAILKYSQDKYGDNISFEVRNGKWINEQTYFFPCFLKTIGFLTLSDTIKADMKSKIEQGDNNFKLSSISNISPKENQEPLSNIRETGSNRQPEIKNQDDMMNTAILLEYFPGTVLYKAKIDFNIDVEEYVKLLFQIYAPLYALQGQFEHADLHQGNIMVEKRITPIHFTYKENKVNKVQFQSNFIVKIIDYGRAFILDMFTGDELQQVINANDQQRDNQLQKKLLDGFIEQGIQLPTHIQVEAHNNKTELRKTELYFYNYGLGHLILSHNKVRGDYRLFLQFIVDTMFTINPGSNNYMTILQLNKGTDTVPLQCLTRLTSIIYPNSNDINKCLQELAKEMGAELENQNDIVYLKFDHKNKPMRKDPENPLDTIPFITVQHIYEWLVYFLSVIPPSSISQKTDDTVSCIVDVTRNNVSNLKYHKNIIPNNSNSNPNSNTRKRKRSTTPNKNNTVNSTTHTRERIKGNLYNTSGKNLQKQFEEAGQLPSPPSSSSASSTLPPLPPAS